MDTCDNMEQIVKSLFDIGAVKFGQFKLKSGIMSPVYFDLRVIVSYPQLMSEVSDLLWAAVKEDSSSFKSVCGVPYTALPLATCIAVKQNIPMLIRRKEAKDYGTKRMIEGHFETGDHCLVVEDVVTSGGSVYETAEALHMVGLKVKDAVVLLNREQGGEAMLSSKGIKLKSVFTLTYILRVLHKMKCISEEVVKAVEAFIQENQLSNPPGDEASHGKATKKRLSYAERASFAKNPVSKRLLQIMETKKTNLCFSVDVTSATELLSLADTVGPYICLLKTHIDILSDFSQEFVDKLCKLAEKHSFLIFEDRKFADIGNTVKHQYSGGTFRIRDWADIVNAHSVPGSGVVQGLMEESTTKARACILIAQMSSKGALLDDNYAKATLDMAKECSDYVIGFICTSRVSEDPEFLHFTPGVHLASQGDALGQQYLTPSDVIAKRGCDVIIVGRGIYKAVNPAEAAKAYKDAGYNAYCEQLTLCQ